MMKVAERIREKRIVSMLEGGYNLAALGRSVVAHVRTLTEHCPKLHDDRPRDCYE